MHLDDGSRLDAVRTCYHHSISTNTKLTVVCAYEQGVKSGVEHETSMRLIEIMKLQIERMMVDTVRTHKLQ